MTLVIGDIHGCYDELRALLDKSGIANDEPIIAIGDLVDRGPQPREVLEFFRNTPNARSLRGNHEQKHIDARYDKRKPPFAQLITRWELDGKYPEAVRYFMTLPYYEMLDDALLVHAAYSKASSSIS